MKSFYQAALLAVFAMTALGSVGAQTQLRDSATKSEAVQPASHQNLYRGSKIIGADVKDPKDKKLGEIKDILLDSGRGEVAYVVVRFGGGPMGVASKYHAIPWKALQASDDGKHYLLHADRETVSKAPAFDSKNWPDMADQKWSAEVDRYWTKMVGLGPPGGISTSSGASSTGAGTKADTRSSTGR